MLMAQNQLVDINNYKKLSLKNQQYKKLKQNLIYKQNP